jgi:hypothetical protein
MKSNRLLTLRGLLAAIVGSIVILSSCNVDETTQGFSDPSREVTFSAYAKKGSRTRIAEMTSDDIEDFDVYGIYNGSYLDRIGGPESNNNTSGPAYVHGSNATSWEYSPKQLWPETGSIDFYAYSPSKNQGANSALTYAAEEITYTVPALGAQEDLLVAVKTGVNCAIPNAVSLNFQHALSRIQLKARPAATGVTYSVSGVSFINLYNEGALALNTGDIPDGAGFPYNDDANDGTRIPLVLWTPDGNPDTKYEFDFSGSEITVDDRSTYADIIVDDEAFLVLPQATELGATVTPGAGDPATGFYVKITYTSSDDDPGAEATVKYFAVREPLNPALNAPLTFEIGRSYTFVVDLSGSEYINFAEVNVSLFDEAFGSDIPNADITPDPDPALTEAYMPAPHKGIAGSNIYWDEVNQRLTFDDVDVTTHEQYQGVYFKWGSLVGISPVGNWDASSTQIYAPVGVNGKHEAVFVPDIYDVDVEEMSSNDLWATIATGSGDEITEESLGLGIADFRTGGYATYLNSDPDNLAAYKGDICAYLSGRPGIPEGYWRIMANAEFRPDEELQEKFESPGNYTAFGTFSAKTSDSDDDVAGTFRIDNGYHLKYASGSKTTFFPASGYRNYLTGALSSVGQYGSTWSSTPLGETSRVLFFNATTIYPTNPNDRAYSHPVRCVKK